MGQLLVRWFMTTWIVSEWSVAQELTGGQMYGKPTTGQVGFTSDWPTNRQLAYYSATLPTSAEPVSAAGHSLAS